MEIEGTNSFKNKAWEWRKKEFKQKRNQRHNKNIKQIQLNEAQNGNKYNCKRWFIDMSIEMGKSLVPAQKYCEITGFPTRYKDKSTQMFFADKYVYQYLRSLNKPMQDQYLALRRVNLAVWIY